MTKKALPKSTLRTLGNLANYYEMMLDTFMTLINANEVLVREIDVYTKNVKQKGQKVLPPIIIDKILTMFGEP